MKVEISKIEAYLEALKISGAEMCRQIGISYSTYNSAKHRGKMTDENAEKIAAFLKVRILLLHPEWDDTVQEEMPQSSQMSLPSDTDSVNLSDRIHEFLGIARINVKQLAELIEMPYRTMIHQLANGVKIDMITGIAKVFRDVNIAWFFDREVPLRKKKASMRLYNQAAEEGVEYGASNKLDEILKRVKAIEGKIE